MLWEVHTEAMRAAMAEHDAIVLACVEAAGGQVVKRVGDGFDTAFADPGDAVSAAQAIQTELSRRRLARDRPAAGADGDRRGRGRGAGRRLLRPRAQPRGPAARRGTRRPGAALRGCARRSRGPLGLAGEGARRISLQGYRRARHVFQLLSTGCRRTSRRCGSTGLRRRRRARASAARSGATSCESRSARATSASSTAPTSRWSGREVAIKVIRPELANEPAFIRRFEAEAQLVAQLEHPHIVPLYDYWREPDGAYLVMRWLRGGSLRQRSSAARGTLEAALALVAQIGGALADAHRPGVVHRDVKPANVLLDEDGNAYLSDFGIAARLQDADDPRRPSRSPAYMSPEELGASSGPPRSDIYSLGLLASSCSPASGRRWTQRCRRSQRCVPTLPDALDAVIGRATAVDPASATTSVDAFLVAFAGQGSRHAGARRDVHGRRTRTRACGLRRGRRGRLLRPRRARRPAPRRLRRAPAGRGRRPIGHRQVVGREGGAGPALRHGALPGSERWFVADMFPGADPVRGARGGAAPRRGRAARDSSSELARDELGIRRVAKRILPRGHRAAARRRPVRGALHAGRPRGVRRRFLDGSTALAADAAARVRVVVTLRADFSTGRCATRSSVSCSGGGTVAITAMPLGGRAGAGDRPARRRAVGVGSSRPGRARSSPTSRPAGRAAAAAVRADRALRPPAALLDADAYRGPAAWSARSAGGPRTSTRALDEPARRAAARCSSGCQRRRGRTHADACAGGSCALGRAAVPTRSSTARRAPAPRLRPRRR